MANRISVILDVMADGANKSLSSFKKSIQDADGAAGKFKAGASGAMDQIKANAGTLALAGGTALVAFGVKAVGAFQDLALESGKLSDALGLTTEEASRYIEVANDVGVSTESLESSIGKMNVTAGKTPQAFADIGAELVKNADGTTNVNETFLSTVDALKKIPDATARAAAAQKIFGKGWKDMAELIELGADGVSKALASVEGGKVIDDAEVERARKFRDSLDQLRGVSEELTVVVGGALVPALTDVADALIVVKDAAGAVGDIMPDMPGWFDTVAGAAEDAINPVGHAIDMLGSIGDHFGDTEEAVKTYGTAQDLVNDSIDAAVAAMKPAPVILDDVAQAELDAAEGAAAMARHLEEVRGQWDQLLGRLSVSDAFRSVQTGFDEIETAATEAWDAAETGADDADVKARDYKQAVDDMTRAVIEDFIPALGSVPKEVTASIVALIDEGKFTEAERRMAALTSARNAIIDVYVKGGDPRLQGGSSSKTPGRASGGPVSAGGTYLVGERGPELLQMGSSSGNVVNASKTAAALGGSGGGNTFSITINGATDPDATVRAIRAWVKRNGPVQGIT